MVRIVERKLEKEWVKRRCHLSSLFLSLFLFFNPIAISHQFPKAQVVDSRNIQVSVLEEKSQSKKYKLKPGSQKVVQQHSNSYLKTDPDLENMMMTAVHTNDRDLDYN